MPDTSTGSDTSKRGTGNTGGGGGARLSRRTVLAAGAGIGFLLSSRNKKNAAR